MDINPKHNNDISMIIMKTMEEGFNALVKEQEKQANQISNIQQELKNTTKASYEAHTKEGKDRFLASLNEQGKIPEDIAKLLDIKTVHYVKRRIRQAKKNGT
jgi:hypothetical protein